MPNHMTSIGFEVHSRADFGKLATYALNNGERVVTKKGIYSYLHDAKGIEIWLQLNKKGEIIGLNPHFQGTSNIKVGVTNEIIAGSNSSLDGRFHAWADPTDENIESGSYPFVFDMPNRAIHGELAVPQIINIQLTAFAHELSVHDSEEDFHESQGSGIKFAAESFIPSGLFKDNNSPSADAIFTGKVIETCTITNEYSGMQFCWALVKTLGGEMDVVMDKELISKEVKVDGIISGSFWLSAKFINNPVITKKTIIQRIFRS